jgi:hypothetical protein
MRMLVRTQSVRYSPVIVLVLALAILSVIGQRTLLRGLSGAAGAGYSAVDRLRAEVEPVVFLGGLVVSRNRHTIAGGVMGCASGAALGAGGGAVFGLATGGVGFAAVPPAAAIGCLLGAASGIAMGYPLDSWALDME